MSGPTVGAHLLQRLRALGVDHLFGIPGDFILPLFEMLGANGLQHVASCNELNAGYGADGYARLRGLGAVAVTYGPGAFSLVNATAGAYAERVPVVVISGGPARAAYRAQPHLHHVLPQRIDASVRIFEQVTVAARVLDDPASAPALLDELLALCRAERRPVYLEIPVDVQTAACTPPAGSASPRAAAGTAVAGAIALIAERLRAGNRTVLLAGHEIPAYGLEARVLALVEKTGLPVASLFSGKACYLEHLPQCIGAYQGAGSDPVVRDFVEGADTVLFLGAVPSDFNLGGNTARLRPDQRVHAFDGRVWTAGTALTDVPIVDLVDGLLAALPPDAGRVQDLPAATFAHVPERDYVPADGTPITNRRLYDRLARHFEPGDVVLADAGCMINLTQVRLPRGARYLASGYWASIGAGLGATVGACFAAAPGQRVLALEGDGSFQMTAQELSTLVRYGLAPTIVVANNRGYTAERLIHDGPFNDIQDWRYHRLAEVFGGVIGEDVRTEEDLERALARAQSHTGPGPLVIEVHLDPLDAPEAFRRMSEGLRG